MCVYLEGVYTLRNLSQQQSHKGGMSIPYLPWSQTWDYDLPGKIKAPIYVCTDETSEYSY